MALNLACDKMVEKVLGIPVFFSGKISYLSSLSGHKEVFVSDASMSSARPQTSFSKITFNPSWLNNGKGIFFTSNERFLIIFICYLPMTGKFQRLLTTEAVICVRCRITIISNGFDPFYLW